VSDSMGEVKQRLSNGQVPSRSKPRRRMRPCGSVSKVILCIAADTLRGLVEKHIKLRFPRSPVNQPCDGSNNSNFGGGHYLAQQETTKAWCLIYV
jgi:hypothetical protein